MTRSYLLNALFWIGAIFPLSACALTKDMPDDPKMIYRTKLSFSAGTGFESGRFFDIKGGVTVGHFRMLNTDAHQTSIAWFRHSYQFQYDFVHSAYGFNANVGYSFFALHGEINFNYRWDKLHNQCLGIAPMLGIDLGLFALRAGPHFYLQNDFTSRQIAFAASLDFYFPSYTD